MARRSRTSIFQRFSVAALLFASSISAAALPEAEDADILEARWPQSRWRNATNAWTGFVSRPQVIAAPIPELQSAADVAGLNAPDKGSQTADGTNGRYHGWRRWSSYRSVLYYANWDIYARNFQVENIPADKLTHVLYSFANIDEASGTVIMSDLWADQQLGTLNWSDSNVYGNVQKLFKMKQQNRQVKTLLSIGGFSWSSKFVAPASTPEGRATFAQSAVQLVKDLGFDGLDVDWEYPTDATQADNYASLLEAIRAELTSYSNSYTSSPKPHFLLTVATAAGPSQFAILAPQVRRIDKAVDFWNLMAYDYSGPWSPVAAHASNLFQSKNNPASTPFYTDYAVQWYLQNGATPRNLVLGMPLYGRQFFNASAPGQFFNGTGTTGTWEPGTWDYKDTNGIPTSSGNGVQIFHDPRAVASWNYNSNTNMLVSYDSPWIAKAKAWYVRGRGLGGGMWWEAAGDYAATSPYSLIKSFTDSVGRRESSQNVLDYPQSKYDNIRTGIMPVAPTT